MESKESSQDQIKKNKKTKQNPVPMPNRETIILQFYTLQHDYISTPYRKYTVLSFFYFPYQITQKFIW